ncbi:hypothetical protein FRB96_009664 [Tulasnella sp. 330]|nr:hypothetical protein FRB96_009664 [Tulasnella sp. 330]KAG8883297.1 hypothetical protein FRB97_006861 [Tulasnella sp. 331]KAG8888680.1 hypothetical protein FRB98_007046 [Tulasnella sp. 332]
MLAASAPTTVNEALLIAGPSRIPPIPPYHPKPQRELARSSSQPDHSRRTRANAGGVSSSPPVERFDLEMGDLTGTNAAITPSSPTPPQYDELPDRLGDFISPPEPTRARPSGGRGCTSGTSSGTIATDVISPHRRVPYLPPPPAFGVKQSPDTVSRTFFFYGFVFPLFWFMGSLVLVLKLHPIPEDCGGKPPSEQADQLLLLRAAEEKWAYRCLAASIVFIIGLGAVIIAVIVVRSHS